MMVILLTVVVAVLVMDWSAVGEGVVWRVVDVAVGHGDGDFLGNRVAGLLL